MDKFNYVNDSCGHAVGDELLIQISRRMSAIVQAIHSVSRAMGIQTIAEWVETAEVLEVLKAIRIDFAQGDYIVEPEPPPTSG